MSLRTAATLPTVLPTAHALVHEVGRLRAGETVLVQGAAGGIGTVAGQLAKTAGAGAVYGVVSDASKAEHARAYGYDEVFVGPDFDEEVRRATGGRGVDLALDPVGGDTFRRSLDALAVFGRLVSFGNASSAEPWQVGLPELYPGGARSRGSPSCRWPGRRRRHCAHWPGGPSVRSPKGAWNSPCRRSSRSPRLPGRTGSSAAARAPGSCCCGWSDMGRHGRGE